MMSKITIILLFHIFLSLHLNPSTAQTWINAGYWFSGSGFPIADTNSALFCRYKVNSSSYELSASSSDEPYFSTFTNTVKQKNPSITTLLSIGGGSANNTVISLMVSNASEKR
jgi:hypothetical protein